MSSTLNYEIETLSQRIAMLTGALNTNDRKDVMAWFKFKEGMADELEHINNELDKILIGKLK